MNADIAIRRYSEAIAVLPARETAINALGVLFRGIRDHKDFQFLWDSFPKSLPRSGRTQHVKAVKNLIFDLADCTSKGG